MDARALQRSVVAAGALGRCPACAKGAMFKSYLAIADKCDACGESFAHADAGDGPAVFVIFAVGVLVAPLLFILQFGLDLPGWLSVALTMAAAVALCLALLPVFKGVLFALQWKHKASEASHQDIAP
jgi:uncharacterized protein (DUF983 family)